MLFGVLGNVLGGVIYAGYFDLVLMDITVYGLGSSPVSSLKPLGTTVGELFTSLMPFLPPSQQCQSSEVVRILCR